MQDVLLESDQDGNHVRKAIIRSFRRGNGNYDNLTISSYHQESNHRILKVRKKTKRKRVRETKEVGEYGHSIIEKKKKKLNEKYLYTERRMEYRRKKK